jgi:ABC-type sugar transport system substrate-binding protein
MRTPSKFALALLVPVLLIALPVAESQQKTLKIAFSIPGFKFPFFRIMETGAKAEAAKLGGVEILSMDGGDDDATQLALCENGIASGIDGMVISPRTTEGLAGCFKALGDKKIPVMTVDRRAANPNDSLGHLGADNVKGGEEAAKFIVARLKAAGNVIELMGTPGASPAIDRSKGFNNIISQSKNIKIVAQQTANFDSAKALQVTEDILTKLGSTKDKPGFDAMFAANDDMALGALEAIKARGIDPKKVAVVGFDALEAALQSIEKGELTGTIDQFPNKQAGQAVAAVVDFIRNKKAPAKTTLLTPTVITLENIKDASTRAK